MYTPFARETFRDLIFRLPPMHQFTELIAQGLDGLAHLHKNGIMHRDVKPVNIAVVQRQPPQAVLIDFGCATTQAASRDHMKGTIPWLALEILALKDAGDSASLVP